MTTKEAADFTAVLQKYDQFINDKLKPDLKATLDSRDALYDLTSEYMPSLTYSLISYGNSLKLKAQIEIIQSNDLKEMKTMVDLGSNFYAQAKIPDTKYIYINVGFGFHVQMTLEEALMFIEKKNKQLQNRADKYSEEAAKIRANIKLVMRAIQEILQLPDADAD